MSSQKNVCHYGKRSSDDRSLLQEKEVGELAPTGQHRKSVVLLVTLGGLSHAHRTTNIIMCFLALPFHMKIEDRHIRQYIRSQHQKVKDTHTCTRFQY